jgi:hypothetical protein
MQPSVTVPVYPLVEVTVMVDDEVPPGEEIAAAAEAARVNADTFTVTDAVPVPDA